MALRSNHRTRPLPKVALITGGGTGIGRGIALALARRGCAVALAGRRAAPLERTAAEVASLGARAVAIPFDLSAIFQESLVARAEEALAVGPLDLLVNNAAVLAGGSLSTKGADEVARAFATNLAAPAELTRQALPSLSRTRGAIILVGSTMSVVPMPYASIYSATKSGLRAFGEALRYETEVAGVHLLMAYPPATRTPMTAAMSRAAGAPGIVRATQPRAVGERIVAALLRGDEEVAWPMDRAIFTLYRVAPWLLRYAFRTRAALSLFKRIMHG